MLGNSLVFDGDWDLGQALGVNCARQGLTAAAAVPHLDALPDVNPDAILLVFGTVEAIREQASVDIPAFRQTMTRMVAQLRNRWPRAHLIIATVPPMRVGLLPDRHKGAVEAIGALSFALRSLAETGIAIQLNDPWTFLPRDEGGLKAAMTHDGVHLTPTAYALWSQAVSSHLSEQ